MRRRSVQNEMIPRSGCRWSDHGGVERERKRLDKPKRRGYPVAMLRETSTIWRRFALPILPVLLVVISAVIPLAYASPPDPSWVKGIYDDADFDDVVVFITSGAGVVEPFLQLDLRLVPPLAGYASQPAEDTAPAVSRSSLQARAPPAS